ncbi:MAG: hypothetical protein ABSG00_08405 [Terracidiphilus sp.]|jgi:hypothetical protein
MGAKIALQKERAAAPGELAILSLYRGWCIFLLNLVKDGFMTERRSLIEKLVTTLHLNVAERKLLEPVPVSKSEISAAIMSVFKELGHFPPQASVWQPGNSVFEGYFLELLTDGRVRLLCQRHIATTPMQLGGQSYVDFSDASQAIDEFIMREWTSRDIDGIPFIE